MMTEFEDGAAVEAPQPNVEDSAALPAPAAGSSTPSSDSRNLAMVAHLSSLVAFAGIPSFIGPLVVWLLNRDRDTFAAEAAREALNFNLSLLIYAALAAIGVIATVGLGLLIVVPGAIVAAVAWLVFTVNAASHSAAGRAYRYPLTLRLVH
jgi:uncharacterized protein